MTGLESNMCNQQEHPRGSQTSPIHPSRHGADQELPESSASRAEDVGESLGSRQKESNASQGKRITPGAGGECASSVEEAQARDAQNEGNIVSGKFEEANPASSGSSESEDNDDGSSPESGKKDERTLRKGKWAVEEEEYTSRVIQHFSAGLLTLPDGATLRSYLADKLNCDPMRITKKFTGACCLGRRVYHLRDRPRATPAELEMAKAERDHLEQRFRLRLEHEQSGLPLARRREILLSQPQGSNFGALFPLQNNLSGGNTLSPWLQNYGAAGLGGNATQSFSLPGNQSFFVGGHPQLSAAITQQNPPRWLLSGSAESIATNSTTPQADPSLQLLSKLVASWAVAQAAASLPPGTLASLAAAAAAPSAPSIPNSNVRSQNVPSVRVAERAPSHPTVDLQQQLRLAYEEQKKEEEQRQLRAAFEEEKRQKEERDKATAEAAASAAALMEKRAKAPVKESTTGQEISPAEQLQKSYEAHLQALMKKEVGSKGASAARQPSDIDSKSTHVPSNTPEANKTAATTPTKKEERGDQPMPDEEAGTVLLGFLNSLRQSYEDAIDDKAGKAATVQDYSKPPNPAQPKQVSQLSAPMVIGADEKSRVGTKRKQAKISDSNPLQDDDRKRVSTPSGFMVSNVGRRTHRPASVTDTSSGNSSSQQAEFSSSLEDSSDKTDPSSSEESDKEAPRQEKRNLSRGPPRKRLKVFTEENLKAHSRRTREEAENR